MERMKFNGQFSPRINGMVSFLKTNHWQQPCSFLLSVILLASCAWILGKTVWLVPKESKAIPTWAAAHVVVSKNDTSIDIDGLKKADLFGHYTPSKNTVSETVKVDAPKTRLNLILVGVVSSSDAHQSLAVISHQGSQDTYGIDEVIDGTRVKLKAVLADRVIINNEGRDETLMLDGLDYTKPTFNPTQPKPEVVMATPTQAEQAKLEDIRHQVKRDPRVLMKYIQLTMLKNDGKVTGYRLTPGSDGTLFRSVGLREGDIAVNMNGIDLTDTGALPKVLATLSNTQEINLTVKRDEQLHDIRIQL